MKLKFKIARLGERACATLQQSIRPTPWFFSIGKPEVDHSFVSPLQKPVTQGTVLGSPWERARKEHARALMESVMWMVAIYYCNVPSVVYSSMSV